MFFGVKKKCTMNQFLKTPLGATWTHRQWWTRDHGVFGSLIVKHPSVQVAHYSTDPPLWVQSHLEDFSIPLLIFLMAILHSWPFILRSLRLHGSNWPAKPGSPPQLVRSGLSSLCSSIQTQEAWQIWPVAFICLLHSVFPVSSTRTNCFDDWC